MISAIIFGCTGYTGLELTRILSSHPEIKIIAGTSRSLAGKNASEVFPFISKETEFPIITADKAISSSKADLAFMALPHGESASLTAPLLESNVKVVDLSADCRIHDLAIYEKWYGHHTAPELLPKAVYGLPEIHRDELKSAKLVANPGCYPTTVILGIAPMIKFDGVDTMRPVVDSKSGVSGAGRNPKQSTSFCEIGESFKPYGVIRHRHIPEMEQELSEIADADIKVRFTPHLIPVSRGMVSSIYLPVENDAKIDDIRSHFEGFYHNEPFVKLLPNGVYPDTAFTRGSNLCLINFEIDDRTGWLVVMVAIDNLGKGASGAAVQNANIIMGLEETLGLKGLPIFP